MPKPKRIWICLGAILLLVAAALVWYRTPVTFLRGVDSSQVERVEVIFGYTEERFLEDRTAISAIIESVQNAPLERDGISVQYAGTGPTLIFYGQNGAVLEELTFNSADTIRKDPFFYRAREGALCYDFILEQAEALR